MVKALYEKPGEKERPEEGHPLSCDRPMGLRSLKPPRSGVGDSSGSMLAADLTLDELHVALTSLANGKAPGIDGIPVDFYKAFLDGGGDYKVLSKALALRLREAMAEVVHVDQTYYCVPGRLAVVDPPLICSHGSRLFLVNFFWDRLHWLPQAVLFLPKEEGGQGLVHLASRGAAFRLQFIQRLLYGPQDLVWRPLAQLTLQECWRPRIYSNLCS
ncbi:hypothetical protein L3Q82_001582 [Scortum barcoo]|uniref:Uncharacterized protein n=1 Tax=Scortum barcoo TaxID=214431 RepID=A0ACB8W7H1_9TELE|nr:hypothetical protein L3Q82_001582 [Scortum barcoo]